MSKVAACITLIISLLPCLVRAGPTTRESRLGLARKLWDQQLAQAGGEAVVSEHYPTEKALPFLDAYLFTRDPKYARQAILQLQYAHGRQTNDLLLTFDNICHRDYQARQIYNFYLAYRVLKDERYLKWADACAAAMIKIIPRRPHTAAGRTHTLFAATFIKPSGEPSDPIDFTIDVNQNAEVGYAFSLLYHDPASRFFHDPAAKEIAYEETLASMSLQVMESGAIALREGEWITGYDTAYGGYATFSWTGTQRLWREPKFEPHLQAAARWLGPKINLARDSQRWYPIRIENGVISYWEAWYRVPLLWHCGVDAHQFISDLFARMEHPELTPNDPGIVPQWWAHFELMGVPREFFIDAESGKR